MVEGVEREATMEEIVTALRETKRGPGRVPAFTVVGSQSPAAGPIASPARSTPAAGTARPVETDPADLAALRDEEIERLLLENARLNERIVFLLKVIEREGAQYAPPASHVAPNTDRETLVRDVRATLERELRPILLVLLRLAERQRGGEPGNREAPSGDGEWIVDADAMLTNAHSQ